MATVPPTAADPEVGYPDSDGQPMAETPIHRDNMIALIDLFRRRFADDPNTYVSGNMFLYYEQGNRKKNVSPDVFVALGVPDRIRRVYQTWVEGKGPDLVVEVTSVSTRDEDFEQKFRLYRDVLKVREYYLFDPEGEYLDPPLQGFRLVEGEYVAIEPVDRRLPSAVLDLHFEARGMMLGLYDPATRRRLLPSPQALEKAESARRRSETARRRAKAAQRKAEAAQLQAEADRQAEASARARAEAETERLRREVDELRRRFPGAGE